jgi:hypothetical protein
VTSTREHSDRRTDLQHTVENLIAHYFKPPRGREVVIVCDNEKLALANALVGKLKEKGCPASALYIADDLEVVTPTLTRLYENGQVGMMMLASHRMWSKLRLYERFEFHNRQPSIQSNCSPVFFDGVIPIESMLRLYSARPTDTDRFLTGIQQMLPNDAPTHITAPGGTDLRFIARHWEI